MRKQPHLGQRFVAIVGFLALAAPMSVAPTAHAVEPAAVVSVRMAGYDAEDAPPSKYLKRVTETSTTVNLQLRQSPNANAASLGVMSKGTVVKLTGKKQGAWSQLEWGSKTGWSATEFLRTRTSTKDESKRFMSGYASIYSNASLTRRIGAVNFRTQVQLLEIQGSSAHIKTSYFHGWVKTNQLDSKQPAKAYRYVQRSGPVYSHYDATQSKQVGRVHHGERYEYRRWDSANRRDEILVNGTWVWTSTTNRKDVAAQYRYAQHTGAVYNSANKKKDKQTGTIRRGTKVRWGTWDSANRRDEVLLNGRWVWADSTNRKAPKTEHRYAQKNGTLYDRASKGSAKKVGTIKAGAKVQWATWDSKNRRDEIRVNGKWVWTDVTNRKKPQGLIPPTVNVADYGRFSTKTLTLLKQPSAKADWTGSVKKGMKVTVQAKADGGWVKIKSGAKTGYIKEKDNLRVAGPHSVAVYGTLRTGQSAYNVMGGFQQKVMNQRISKTALYQLWNRNWTFLTNGSKSVVTEQFQYSDQAGPSMLKKLDRYESQLKYQGRVMYTRQKVRLTDGSQSWTYKTTPFSEKVVKRSGRYISSGDFLKRS
ncbi:SH3 domain-containing protein [Glutamicibacter ardleyensis]|uniref:SH3 domain-containing protein n=1 Tax=Glutamicibacter ardleyensis TaxID=225894 RepID=UPI003FD22632